MLKSRNAHTIDIPNYPEVVRSFARGGREKIEQVQTGEISTDDLRNWYKFFAAETGYQFGLALRLFANTQPDFKRTWLRRELDEERTWVFGNSTYKLGAFATLNGSSVISGAMIKTPQNLIQVTDGTGRMPLVWNTEFDKHEVLPTFEVMSCVVEAVETMPGAHALVL